jgi:hypothetical protein
MKNQGEKMKNIGRLAILGLLLAVASGCATRNSMGLLKSDATVDVSKNSLALMTVRVDHAYRSSVTPFVRVVYLERPEAKEKEDRLNFVMDAQANAVGPDGQDFLVRMAIPPGKYTVMAVGGGGGLAIFPGTFLMPLLMDIDISPGTVTYLGRIEGRTRERSGNEFRAGPVIPLIDQAATGWSGSTWDVTVRDAYESDMQRMRAAFPALKTVNVGKNVMRFERDKAQAWWEKH